MWWWYSFELFLKFQHAVLNTRFPSAHIVLLNKYDIQEREARAPVVKQTYIFGEIWLDWHTANYISFFVRQFISLQSVLIFTFAVCIFLFLFFAKFAVCIFQFFRTIISLIFTQAFILELLDLLIFLQK